jgi:LCP family protein required for cell wall assembly
MIRTRAVSVPLAFVTADAPPPAASPPPPARRSRRGRRLRRTWPQRLVVTGSVLMSIVCLGAALAVWYANHRLEDLERVVITHASAATVAGSAPTNPGSALPTIDTAPGAAQNYLLVGSDSRAQDCTAPDSPFAGGLGNVTSNLSDTIILVRVDPQTSQAAILSFPRDLWVTVAGTGRKAKINSAYEPDNPSRLVQTIEQNFDVFVDHTVQVSLCAFKSLVDAVGGVNVPFAYPTRDPSTGFNVPAGCIAMNGDEALAYVRSRKDYQYMDATGWHTDPTSDYGRIARQQDFIRRALQKAVDKGARNVGVARDLLDVALANVVVDQDLTINDLLRLATTLRDFDPAQLREHSYRVEGQGATQGGESVIIPDVNAPTTKAVLQVFRGQARLSDVAPQGADAGSAAPATTTATTASTSTGATSTTVATTRTTASTTAGPTTTPTPGASTTVPVVDVAPNPIGIAPPDDPTCR